jgi:HK97 family phage prohead protease
MRRFLSPDELTADLATRDAVASAGFSLSPSADSGGLEDRCISYRFSDASVGRDMHTIQADAWDIANFERNPVFLWAHQDDELPVGRVENLRTAGGQLLGQVRYADHPFADTVYRLVKGGFLNATSTGWLPQQWKAANDRARPGGLDFTRVELLEISQVPVPALPTALVTARKAGIDTRPLVSWAERLLDVQNFAVLPRGELEALRKAAAEPARRRKPAPNPSPVPKADPMKTVTELPAAPKRDPSSLIRMALARGLGHVAEMAAHLRSLEDLHSRMCDEAETEGDGSPNPEKMRVWLDDGHDMLRAMCGEETQEYKDGTQAPENAYYWSAATLEAAVARALDARGLGVSSSNGRKGAKHSAETIRCMRAIKTHVRKAHDQLAELLSDDDSIGDEGDDPDADDENARAARKAKAEALKAKLVA